MPTDWAEFTPETTDWSEFTPEETTKSPGYLGPSWPAQEGEEAPQAPAPMPEDVLQGLSRFERFRMTPFARGLLGPTQVEREGMAGEVSGSQVVPQELLNTVFQFASVPPPIAEPIKAVTQPLIEAQAKAQQAMYPWKLAELNKGIAEGVRDLGLELPLAAGAVGMGKNIGRAMLGLFSGEFLISVPEQYQAFKDAAANKNWTEAAKIATKGLLTGALLGSGGIHETRGALAELAKAKREQGQLPPTELGLARLKENLLNLVGRPTGLPIPETPAVPPLMVAPHVTPQTPEERAIAAAEPLLPQAAQAVKETKGVEYATEKGLQPSDVRQQRAGDDQGRTPQGPGIGGGLQPATPSAAAEAPRPAQGQAGVLLGKEPLILAAKRTPEDAYEKKKATPPVPPATVEGALPPTAPGPMPPGPGAASPAEFAQRQAGQGSKPPLPPPPNPPVALDAAELPTPDKIRQAKDYTPFNRLNTSQWNFYFGHFGGAAKDAWERMNLGEFKMRESIARDVQDYVLRPLKALPRPLRKQGGKAFYEILDGKKMEDIRKEWENKPDGDVVIAQAEGIRTRLEEIRTTIRDLKRDSYTRALSGMNKDALVELFQKNVSDKVDISAYTKDDLANGLVREAYPDDWGIADGSYLPHLFFGHWKVSVFVPDMEKPQFVTRAQTAHEADVAVFKLVKQNPELKDAHFTIEEDTVVPADMIRLGDRKFWRMIMEMKDQAQGAIDPKQAVQGIIGRKSTKQKWFGSLQHRIGLEGYSKDYRRVMSAYLSGFHRWKELTAINREVQPLIEQTARDKHGQAAQRLTDIFDNLWGKPTRLTVQFDNLIRRIPVARDRFKPLALDRLSRTVVSLTTNLMLRTLRFGVINRLQPLQGLYPMVGERIMVQAKIRQHTKEGRALLDEAGVTFDPGQYSAEGLGGKFTRSMERLSGEQSNQELAFLAMYQHGIERGLAKPEAIKYAKLRGQLLTQFTPMITDMPELFEGPVGRVLFQFKRFPVKQVELMAHMAGQRQFGGLTRMLLMFGAIGGTSFFLRQFFVDPEKRLRFKRAMDEQFGEKTADGIMYGLPGLLGADISGSIVLGEEPWGANIYEKAGRQLAGPTISMGIEAVRGIRKEAREPISEWDRALAVMRRIPSLRQLAEVESLLSGDLDVMTPEGERKFRRTVTDALMGLGAFKSANEANLQVAVNGILEVQKERKAIMNRYFVASLQGSDAVGKAVKEVIGFNERWPEYAITSENMSRYRDYRERNIGKTDVERAVPKQLIPLLPASQR